MLRQIDPPPAEDVSRYCGNCGYDLRGSAEPRCPECGMAFDPAGPAMANVPWFHRHIIGYAAALGRTTWIATFQTHRLIDEVARDTLFDVRAAKSFRLICVTVAAGSTALLFALVMPPFLPVPLGVAVSLFPLLLLFRM